jgi:hypothetical protein
MNAAHARFEVSRSGLEGIAGSIAEGPLLMSLGQSVRGTRVRVIRSFDFAQCDCMIALVDQVDADYPFPDNAPLSSFERLAWAWHHRNKLHGVTCDVKTGAPLPGWLTVCNASMFFIRIVGEEQLFAVPRKFVLPLFSARQSRDQIDEKPEVFPSFPSLAPFAVPEDDWPVMMEWLLLGDGTTGSWAPRWEMPSTSPLDAMFQFNEPEQADSFKCVWRLYLWLREWQPQVHLHHVLTQPLGGDFVLVYQGEKYTIQHKVSSHNPISRTTYANFFDLMFWHRGDDVEAEAALEVMFRDGSYHTTFQFDKDGANGLVEYIKRHGEDARKMHVIDMGNLMAEAPPRPRTPTSWPISEWDSSRSGEAVATRRTKSRCHYMAKRFYEYVNGDPDHLDIPIACVFLNWDQSHIFGEAIVVLYKWMPGERDAFRRFGTMPVSLVSLALSTVRPKCIVLRFCCRDYHHRSKTSSHFPLQQVPVEMPLTDQPFFLICAPDSTLEKELPESLMLFPSAFINFPKKVEQVWKENDDVWGSGSTEYQLNLLLGHTQPTRKFNGTMVKDGVVQSNFWLTPGDIVRQLEQMFHTSGDITIQRHEACHLTNPFPIDEYLTEVPRILEAAVVYGSVRPGSPWKYRDCGFYGSRRV